jgi:HSP20 family protein
MVDKLVIKRKMGDLKSSVSGKKEDVNDKINGMKGLVKNKKSDIQNEAGKWRKLAPKLFV